LICKKFHPQVLEYFKVEAKDRQYQIWKRNPLSVDILSKKVLEQKLNYIHQTPIQEKWKLIDSPENYKYSSASFYIENKKCWSFLTHYMMKCESGFLLLISPAVVPQKEGDAAQKANGSLEIIFRD